MSRLLLVAVVLLLVPGLAGCFRTRTQMIGATEAEAVLGPSAKYAVEFNRVADGPTGKADWLRFDRRGNGNDYVLVSGEDGDTGVVRFRRLANDLYLAQYDAESLPSFGEPGYDIVFLRIAKQRLSFVMPLPPGAAGPSSTGKKEMSDWWSAVLQGELRETMSGAAEPFNVDVPDTGSGLLFEGAAQDIRHFFEGQAKWPMVELIRLRKVK